MSPLLASRRPSTISRVVVLPAPFGPSKPKISPRRTSNESPLSTDLLPYDLHSRRTDNAGPSEVA